MKLKNSKHKVAVFCGSMFGSNKNFKDLAITVTKYLAQMIMTLFMEVEKMD